MTNIHFASATPHTKCNKPVVLVQKYNDQLLLSEIQYGDGAGNVIEKNSSVFSLIQKC